jgi:hypothetical protein
MRRFALTVGLVLAGASAQAQVVHWVSVLTVDAGGGTKFAEARCFAYQGPALGEQCPGWDWPLPATDAGANPPVWFIWSVERCTVSGCVAVDFHQTTYPWRIIVGAMSGPALYRVRAYLPMSGYIWGEAAFRIGRIDPLLSALKR